ncbi:ABC transporter ATP-binding protein [Acidianus hospitalis W1]|uniref:ABC transporter ATP-binding protein n=1 Tax=Acidianus hospitalis (strain W1) TaxID=933801 RepID=F4B6J0_ACIHW|nr:ABC transporter ATP-binding protein [Acidianus hospitalis]AEE94610.1 ABC transporter ATP-binding protein [Acidianus hospitalis W1]
MIAVERISKRFGSKKVLDNVSFDVKDGEIAGFVGLNGAGKTTTIRILAGVLTPNSGDVLIDDLSIVKEKEKASMHVGWVPELPLFDPNAKALDYFVFIAGYYGISKSDALSLGKRLFEEVGLAGREKDKLRNYSQGMKRRFLLAVSLISDPKNFLFDEVLNGLDPEGIQFFRDMALKFKKEGKSVLFSSHILSEVESIADKVIFIHQGKILRIMEMNEIRKIVKSNDLKIILGKVDDNVLSIAKSFGKPELNGNTLIIHDFNGELSELSSKLSPYEVLEVSRLKNSLEDVFFKIINGEL